MYPPRSIRRFLLAAAAPVLAVALLAGCGGGAAETTNDADPVTESNSEQIDTQGSGDSADSSDATRVCEALTAVDPDTVFAELTFGEPEPSSYQVRCKLPVTNAEYGATEPRFVVGFRGFLGAYTSPSVMAAMGSLSGLGNSSAMEPSDR